MADKADKGAYVVFSGRNPGVYDTWEACEPQVHQIAGSIQGGYENRNAAEAAWQKHLGETTTNPNAGILEEFRRLCNLVQNKILSPQVGQGVVGNNLKRPSPPVDNTDPNNNEQPAAKKLKAGPVVVDNFVDSDTNSEDASVSEVEKIELTPAQNAVLEMALNGDNIFLTGAAGSGKTLTLKRIIERLTQRSTRPDEVQVVAPTGIAALSLDGKTIHSFAGWNRDSFQKPIRQLLTLASKKQYVTKAINALKVLIIEEISMVESQLLERLNLLLQKVLDSQKPFGGVEVIFVGDFHQLPPVKPFEHCLECGKEMSTSSKGKKGPFCDEKGCKRKGKKTFRFGDKWAFKAPVWTQLGLRHVKLEQIHRQKEARFQHILNKIANSIALTDQEWSLLEEKKTLPANAFAVRLMAIRKKVDSFNNNELKNIDSETHSWNAFDMVYKLQSGSAEDDKALAKEMKREYENASKNEHRYRYNLTLKVGAKVVLLRNLDFHAGLVNGSQGQVITFESNGTDSEYKSMKRPWEKRCRSFEDENHRFRPVVRFENGKVRTIEPDTDEATKTCSYGQYRVSRTQIPLALGWALSIHKSQGMTLQHVNVSSNDIFGKGQLYVGLSRATTLDGLTLTGYAREQMLMDEDVLAFYKNTKWESLGPNPSCSPPSQSNERITQRPRGHSASKVLDEATERYSPETADSSPRAAKEANQEPPEPARSRSFSLTSTDQNPQEETRIPPQSSNKTISESSPRQRGSSPPSLTHTALKSPLEHNRNISTAQKHTPKSPIEKKSSGPTKSMGNTTSAHLSQKTPQRPTKPTVTGHFKVVRPMIGNIRPSIEPCELPTLSLPKQMKPIDVIDLVSSDDEGV